MFRKFILIPVLLLTTTAAYAQSDACDYRQEGPATVTEQLTNLIESDTFRSGALTLALRMNENGCLTEQLLSDGQDTPRFIKTLYGAYGDADNLNTRLKAAMLINRLHESDTITEAGFLEGYNRDSTVRSMAQATLVAIN